MLLSPYIVAVAVAWIVAQGLKYIILAVKGRTLKGLRHLYLSGNMPSAHTATVIALLSVIGLRDGVDTAVFAVAALFAAIVMYDAVMVRRSVGEQGKAIKEVIREQKSKVGLPRSAKGHEPLEVLVGALLGTIIGLVVFLATQ